MKNITKLFLLFMGIFALQNAQAQGGKKIEDHGITSSIHQKYLGKIVFSSQTVQKDNPRESAFVSSFSLGEPLHFRVFMAQSLVNALSNYSEEHLDLLAAKGFFDMVIVLDGKYKSRVAIPHTSFAKDEKRTWTTWRGVFKAEGEPEYGSVGYKEFAQFVGEQSSHLTPGEHTLHIEIMPAMIAVEFENAAPLAVGDLKMTVGASAIDPNDPLTCLPKAMRRDPNMERKILAAFNAKGWPEKAVKVVIIEQGWTIERNQLSGVPIRRTVAAAIGSTRGNECISQTFNFAQDYVGDSYSDNLYLRGTGDQKVIPCACLRQ